MGNEKVPGLVLKEMRVEKQIVFAISLIHPFPFFCSRKISGISMLTVKSISRRGPYPPICQFDVKN
ncbi:hypothetical protein ACJIZ3_021134 [Penstemon smallii]|uniref:Uncharacterized protein n=1 Tax=Penstemon smallii TaxID=265156 RepID=A0ABD3SKW7_9LAMI